MSRSKNYKKLKNAKGIYQNDVTHKYLVEKRISGKLFTATFLSLYDAKEWQKRFDGKKIIKDDVSNQCSTLKEVWETMQRNHFPILATSTKDIWHRRYKMLQTLEHLPMNLITPSKVSEWVIYWVGHFTNDDYQNSGRGLAGRCNLNNELNY